ncbi:MAG: hypothetical protein ABI843_02360 [Dokdonella sp.]
MRVTCPNCCETYPIDAGFADDDGKRLAALFAEFEPVLGRAVISYLRLFKPAKSSLRTQRAIRVVQDLLDLVRIGTVCRDERGCLRRPAPSTVWASGIEQMLAAPGKLTLPLQNHHYLRSVVFGLADQVDAAAERSRETAARSGVRSTPAPRETPLQSQLKWLDSQHELGLLTDEQLADEQRKARITFGASTA